MKIVADENIPQVKKVFAHLGEVTTLPGRAMKPQDLRDTDLLLVRSVTQVDEQLLKDSRVQFVGTATIGTDHLDLEYFEKQGIRWCSAPGSNADSVAEYLVATLVTLASLSKRPLAELALGVVGCGNVGRRVAQRAKILGLRVIENDPPLARETGDARYRPIEELLGCDCLTLHTPLTYDGPDQTYHLVDDAFVARMNPQIALINTSRGAVVDNGTLKRALENRAIMSAVLDVWENEPRIDLELLRLCVLGTPHIAGYAADGKVRGTWMVYSQCCEWLREKPQFELAWLQSKLRPWHEVRINAKGKEHDAVVREAVMNSYPITIDDQFLRGQMRDAKPEERGHVFDLLRKNYPERREFSAITLRIKHAGAGTLEMLRELGFHVRTD